MLDKSESDIEQRYTKDWHAPRRTGCAAKLAIILTKHNLWGFILDESYPDRPVEVFGKQELLQLLDQFFDLAIHSAAVGYEWAAEANARADNKARRV